MKRLGLVALVSAALLAAGCTSSSGPELPGDTDDDPRHYHLRTHPDSVFLNLELAYEHENAEEYLKCLADSFVFYLSDDALIEDPSLPPSWDRNLEQTIHENMFAPEGTVEEIALYLMQTSAVDVPGPEPCDPHTWEYTFGVQLQVHQPDSIALVATAPSFFVLQVDPDGVGPSGEDLWEIVRWHDLNDRRDRGNSPVIPMTWGSIKARFR